MPTTNALEVQRLAKSFAAHEVLGDVSFRVAWGEVVGLLGENGSGKSTLLKMIAGQIRPDSGSIRVSGVRVDGVASHRRFRPPFSLAWGLQLPRVVATQGLLDNVVAGARPGVDRTLASVFMYPREHDERLLVDYELAASLVADLVNPAIGNHGKAGDLSFGQARRLSLCRLKIAEPRLLLLDEPTAGLEEQHFPRLRDWIAEHVRAGCAVVLVEHDRQFVRSTCSRILQLQDGRVREGDGGRNRHGTMETAPRIDPVAVQSSDTTVPVANERVGASIELEDAAGAYVRNQHVFHGLTLRLLPGQAVAFIGGNGSGKTSALRALAGLLPTTFGRIRVLDAERSCERRARLGRKGGISFGLQGARVFERLTISENVRLSAGHLPRFERARALEEAYGLFPELEAWAVRNAATLSGGERQLVSIAQALLPRPRVLLIDEPSAGLSEENRARVLSILRQRLRAGCSVVLVEHDLEFASSLASIAFRFRLGDQPTPGQLSASEFLPHRLV